MVLPGGRRVKLGEGPLTIGRSGRQCLVDDVVADLRLVDLARHAARVYAKETELSEEDAMAQIAAGIQAELDDPSDPGSTQAIN